MNDNDPENSINAWSGLLHTSLVKAKKNCMALNYKRVSIQSF